MIKKAFEITEAELEVMKVLWANGEPTSTQTACDMLVNKEWKYNTVSTLLSRMVEKGAVAYEKRGKFYFYSPTIKEQDYKEAQTKSLVSKLYDGSVKKLAVSLFKAGEMSAEDIEDIKKMFNL